MIDDEQFDMEGFLKSISGAGISDDMKELSSSVGEQSKYSIGDTVEVKSWEEMEAEYGLDEDGAIKVPMGFTEGMRKFCGKQYVVTKSKGGRMLLEIPGETPFGFSEQMVKFVSKKVELTDKEIEKLVPRFKVGKKIKVISEEDNFPIYSIINGVTFSKKIGIFTYKIGSQVFYECDLLECSDEEIKKYFI